MGRGEDLFVYLMFVCSGEEKGAQRASQPPQELEQRGAVGLQKLYARFTLVVKLYRNSMIPAQIQVYEICVVIII